LALWLAILLVSCSGSSGGGGGGDGGGERRGWQLDERNTGLAGVGIVKEELPLYTGPARPERGTVIREQRIETGLDLSAGDITIERCWIHPATVGAGMPVLVTYDNNRDTAPAPAMVTIRDSDIDGSALPQENASLGFAGNGTVERCHVYGVGSGIAILHAGTAIPALVQGNYVHGLRAWGDPATTGSHNDGLTIRDYAGPSATIRNNRIDCSSGNDTGAFFIQPFSGPIDDVLAEGNLFEGGGYNIVLGRQNYDYGRNIRIVDNRFHPTLYGVGYVAEGGLGYGWAEWSENYLNDPTQPDNKGAPATTGRSP
jgi:hypothetical protein